MGIRTLRWRPLIVSLLADMYPVVADASVERLASAAAARRPALAGHAFANARALVPTSAGEFFAG